MWVKGNAGLVLMTICSMMCLDTVHAVCTPDCGVNGVCDVDTCLCTPPYVTSLAPCDVAATPANCSAGLVCAATEVCTSAVTCSSTLTPNDCATLACAAGTTCMTLSDGSAVRCHCDVDMTGDLCQCTAADVDYDPVTGTCWCKAGKGGADCTIECHLDCTDGCTAGGVGDCIDVTACPTAACVGGTCTSYRHDTTASVKCLCEAGVTGTACDECTSAAGCSSNGTCDTSICTCDDGYVGALCQHECPAECSTSCEEKTDATGAQCSGGLMLMASFVMVLAALLNVVVLNNYNLQ